MNIELFLCTDLDRTLLPNGEQEESPFARELFAKLVNRDNVVLTYVTGRDKALVLDAINTYQIPLPDYVISDVGSMIYKIVDGVWQLESQWQAVIANDWPSYTRTGLQELFSHLSELNLQEPSKQNIWKLSYYVSQKYDHEQLIENMQAILKQHNVQAEFIWSIDDITQTGLLDILPASAGKYQAMSFLMRLLKVKHEHSVFSGDSGNDLSILGSPAQSVLVANASESVREQAIKLSEEKKNSKQLYLAKGGYLNMNGNYSAGIIEGVVHFVPQAVQWIATNHWDNDFNENKIP